MFESPKSIFGLRGDSDGRVVVRSAGDYIAIGGGEGRAVTSASGSESGFGLLRSRVRIPQVHFWTRGNSDGRAVVRSTTI